MIFDYLLSMWRLRSVDISLVTIITLYHLQICPLINYLRSQIQQIFIVSTHMKLLVAVARHSLKCLNNKT